MKKKIAIIGGGGYVGTELVPVILDQGHEVVVFDLFLYGNYLPTHENLSVKVVDIRNINFMKKEIVNFDTIIHLACISNDPSFELNPDLGKSINYDCFEPLIKVSKDNGVKKFIFASSSSVYGVKKNIDVTEKLSLEPLTDYSKYKAKCEDILFKYNDNNFNCVILRPATVCGYSKRQRLDVVVNIFANFAYHKNHITIFGGKQLRPNINIIDMVNSYLLILNADNKKINGEIYNVGYENYSLIQLAEITKKVIGEHVQTTVENSNDDRSYHINSDKIINDLNFKYKHTIENAIESLNIAFKNKILLNTFHNEDYFNIKKMQKIKLV